MCVCGVCGERGMEEKEVCVTGGTGFIASHIVKRLLQRGYRVRATVRDPDDAAKTGFLWELAGAKERLRLVRAELLEDGSFDKAVEGVAGVFHVASPVVVANWQDPEKSLLDPCLKGTTNVLRSCAKSFSSSSSTSSMKRVILTSSCSAIRYDYNKKDTDPPLDESHWSNVDYCKQFQLWYAWAKTLAEKEAWRFAHEKGLDLVVVNPSFAIGPTLSKTPTSTIDIVLKLLDGALEAYPNSRMGYVHIDDVVSAHVLAYENPNASGRLICSGEVYHWRDVVSMLKKKYPMYPTSTTCGIEQGNDIPHGMDTRKLKSLGLEYFESVEKMFDDCVLSLRQHGLLHEVGH